MGYSCPVFFLIWPPHFTFSLKLLKDEDGCQDFCLVDWMVPKKPGEPTLHPMLAVSSDCFDRVSSSTACSPAGIWARAD
jgi:hypothetical protein